MSYSLEALSRSRDIPPEDWARLAPAGDTFLCPAFFNTLEDHGAAGPDNGWQPFHLQLRDAPGAAVALVPSYIKSHSHGDFSRDWQWAAAYRQLGKAYYPKLLSGLPYTPVRGPRFMTGSTHPDPGHMLATITAVRHWMTENAISSWHVVLPRSEEVPILADAGFLISHDVQFHWRDHGYGDFDGYLAAFPSAKRRKVKAERRRVAESGLRIEVRHGHEIPAPEWAELQPLYAATFDKYGNYAAISAECFAEWAQAVGGAMVVFVAYDAARPIALSICFRDAHTLYGRYWGCIETHHSLHFELCFYQGIAYCLREGLTTFEPGAGGEHKVSRGFEPTIVASCHWLADQRMRNLIGDYLGRQRAHVEDYAREAAAHLPFCVAA